MRSLPISCEVCFSLEGVACSLCFTRIGIFYFVFTCFWNRY